MHFFKTTIMAALVLSLNTAFAESASPSEISLTNATWKFDKQSAYALQHDDYCSGTQGSINTIVVPALSERGLTASFGIIAKGCWGELWEKAREHVDAGFTLFNHSLRHTPAFKPSWEKKDFKVKWDHQRDITEANKIIHSKTGYLPTFMAMPYDISSDESYEYVRDHPDLIAMRAPVENNGSWSGNLGVNSQNFHNAYKLKVEVFHNWSPYWKLGKKKRLPAYLQATIDKKGFGIQYFHGVDDETYYAVSKSEYLHFLDKLKEASDKDLVWVGDASEIVNYRYAREYCSLVLTEKTDASVIFSVDGLLTKTKQCSQLNRQLTAVSETDIKIASIKQGGKEITFSQTEGQLLFEYDTSKGDIELQFAL